MKLINNNRVFWFKSQCLQVYKIKNERVMTIKIFEKYFTFYTSNLMAYFFPKLYKFRRKYLPSKVLINYYDCDSGGQCFASIKKWVLNDKHLVNLSDGETRFRYLF
jgi:hypothetical protein